MWSRAHVLLRTLATATAALRAMSVGDTVAGVIKSIEDFSAFVNLCAVDGHTRGPQEVFLEDKDGFRGMAFAPDSSYWEGRAEKALAQVQRQLAAIPPGAVLEWHVSDPYGAAALRRLFQDRLIYDVDVIYTPKAP